MFLIFNLLCLSKSLKKSVCFRIIILFCNSNFQQTIIYFLRNFEGSPTSWNGKEQRGIRPGFVPRRLFGSYPLGKQTSANQVGERWPAIPLECRALLFEDSVSSDESSPSAKVFWLYCYINLLFFLHFYLFIANLGSDLKLKSQILLLASRNFPIIRIYR